MLASIVTALFFLALLPVWWWLDLPGRELNGWMFTAYAFIFGMLAGYWTYLNDRERKVLRQRFRLALALGDRQAELRERSTSRNVFEILGLASVAVGLVLVLRYAPRALRMGTETEPLPDLFREVQRIFYPHVASAWVAFLAFGVVFVASIHHLARRTERSDQVARSSAEVGVVFTSIVLVSGPIWARPVWNTWWEWDARLTTTLLLWLLYLGYLMLRSYIPDPRRQAVLAAAVGVLGFVGVIIDYFAIRWWYTLHPSPVFAGGPGSGLDPRMLRAFLFMLGAFTCLYVAMLLQRLEVARLEAENEELESRAG